MKTIQERIDRLHKKLEDLSVEGKNRKVLIENFGLENLQRLPFSEIEWDENHKTSDGIWSFRVNLLTGQTSSECSIANGPSFDVISKIDQIEKAIHDKLDMKS